MEQASGNDPQKSVLPPAPSDVSAFVGHGVEFKGMLTYKGSVRIDGQFDGEIETDDTLFIGDHAMVTAQIRAGSVIASGRVTGNITARERVELKSPAIIDASLQTPNLSIGTGVVMNGDITMRGPGTVTPGKPEVRPVADGTDSLGLSGQSSSTAPDDGSRAEGNGSQTSTEDQSKKKK
ncbi:MAG: polymer-forming cytoskeletal protein [Nitrospirota bacterium]|nr:polymer-forming cytoskeletal protein [Nitrospirota bacterium]